LYLVHFYKSTTW